MATKNLRQRKGVTPDTNVNNEQKAVDEHPAGEVQHGKATQWLRLILFVAYFYGCCITIAVTQFLGSPLYLINRDYFYAYMALTKQSFGLVITVMTRWWSPTVVRISGDASVAGQMRKTADGRVEFSFPDRLVMIANHQIYTDWIYLWWSAYANSPQMHGHIYIILKESLKYVPVIGTAMMFYGFIFMSRKMAKDQARLAHRLGKLRQVHSGPMSGTKGLDPMWLLIFPEGTNISDNTKPRSDQWAEKIGVKPMRHLLLPRSTGTFFCLNELKDTVDYVYDCAVAYEGVPRGEFGQDYFTLTSSYLEGRPPKSVNMYWRRFAVADIPLQDHDAFEIWLRERWYEKDDLMEQFLTTGRFPANEVAAGDEEAVPKGVLNGGFIETEVKPAHWWEIGNVFVVLGAWALVANIAAKFWNLVVYGNMRGFQY
ncbi:putative 1-acyl-sn-glycerol-3-phosphate acyltransferase gamma [Coleophoma cylindrospora]|uniref:Putative 1-acyl-sn-glycerol-3-phosphate acyltransferase gamma n=1 Tax=Coleophoma cylindrospora TaxID=1849047 RepID=A0A3D8SEC3_9HELO|nr:putative 1-acyl-sn-glycerol-3-phosphate acyltransferase gamma [Coleophoma cylindrospora]